MGNINYQERIPNNVDLSTDRRLQRALEAWQPDYLDWWMEMGPEGFQNDKVYLRTAVSVQRDGWAHFDYVAMPEYRWGIFLTPHDEERVINFGDHMGDFGDGTIDGTVRLGLAREGDPLGLAIREIGGPEAKGGDGGDVRRFRKEGFLEGLAELIEKS